MSWLVKQYDDLFRKKRVNKGKEMGKRWEKRKFSTYLGKNVILEREGGAKKCHIFGEYHP